MIDILFVGTFLSKKKGTFPVSENISSELEKLGFSVVLCSSYEKKLIRMFHIIINTLTQRYKIIHIDVFSGPAFYIAEVSSLLSSLRKKRIILTLHGGNLPAFFDSNAKRVIRVFSRVDYIQTPSISLQKFFVSKGIEVAYLPNPLILDNFPYKQNSVGPISLLWVRAFSEIYNPQLAINTLYELKKSYPEITLTMIGPDKGNLAETKNKISKLGLKSSVKIIGPVKNNLLYKFYQSHDIFINTTKIESFGVAVIEAASCGIPIVSSCVGELGLLWKHDENILFAKSDEYSFGYQIRRLIESESLKLKLSRNARKRIEQFDSQNIIQSWSDILMST